MVNKDNIMRLLKRNFRTTGEITIDDEGLVSCKGNVELKQELKHERLPVSFDRIYGYFWCSHNQLETLAGTPRWVRGNFTCTSNQLTTLEGSLNSVGGDFWCFNNSSLRSLEGLPDISGTLFLSYSPTLPLLRCLLAKKVQFIPKLENKHIETILNHYAGQGEAGAFLCGAELATAGFKENARW